MADRSSPSPDTHARIAGPQHPVVLGVDVGGTHIRAAAIAHDGTIVARRHLACRAADGFAAVVDRLVAAIEGAAADADVLPDAPVGVALPGPVNPRTGVLGLAPNLPGWRDVPIRDLLAERLGRPVVPGNDVNVAALGEWRYGAGQGVRDLVYLGVGTGVGGGVVAGGRLLLGRHGLAMEAGHMVVDMDGPECHCGGRGCLEAHCAGWAIGRTARDLLAAGRSSILPELAAERGTEVSGALVNEAARAGDALAIEVLALAGRALGVGVASLVHIFNPEIVAIGGGVATAGELLFAPMREAFAAQVMASFREDLRIVPSALDQDAGLLGAGVLAAEEFRQRHDGD